MSENNIKNNMLFCFIAMVAISILVFLGGCIQDENQADLINDFVGVWNATIHSQNATMEFDYKYSWTFYENSTGYFETFVNGTLRDSLAPRWRTIEITKDKLIISPPKEGDNPLKYDYAFSEDKQQLIFTIEDGSITFSKQ